MHAGTMQSVLHLQVLGAPLASGLLMADGFLNLKGWQWLFLLEGLPTVFMALWVRILSFCQPVCT